MRKFRTAAALALCAICLLQTAAPVLAAEDYPAPMFPARPSRS